MQELPLQLVGRFSGIEQKTQELRSMLKQTRLILSSTRDELSEHPEHSDDEELDRNDEQLHAHPSNMYEDIEFEIGCLTELRPSLQQNLISINNPTVQALHLPSVPFYVSGPAESYVSIVRDKYQQAENQLVERLGEANWQRHVRIRKRMASLDAPLEEEDVSSVIHPSSVFRDSALGSSVPAQTQYALSHASFNSSIAEGEKKSLSVPSWPAEAIAGKPFQCFICGLTLSNIKNRNAWKSVPALPRTRN